MLPLEEQVTVLNLSVELKELGVPQKSVWFWTIITGLHSCGSTISTEPSLMLVGDVEETLDEIADESSGIEEIEYYSAFSIAELLELFPLPVREKLRITSWYGWRVSYDVPDGRGVALDTLVNSLAQLLVRLIEDKVVTFS